MAKQWQWAGALALGLFASACSTARGPDPWRGYNEPVFGFNDSLDRWVLGPVARGWDWLMPDFVLSVRALPPVHPCEQRFASDTQEGTERG